MHELSIALGIIDIAEEEAAKHGGAPILAVHLKMGPLSGVVKEALRSAFDLAREGSVLAAANLVIEDVPLVVFCAACQKEQTLSSIQNLTCPDCGVPTGDLRTGRELEVTAMELGE